MVYKLVIDDDYPLVSIVTPSFNKGRFIEETILSVKNQTYKNIEHIIIDGGSTDNTLEILNRYLHLNWMTEPDTGQSDAINKGWREAGGNIFAFLNADDTYLPDTIGIIVGYFAEHPGIDMVYGDGILTDEHGKILDLYHSKEYRLKDLVFCRDNIFQPSVFLRRGVVKSVGDMDVNLHLALDLDYWIRIGLQFNVGYIPQPLSAAKIYHDAKSSAMMFKYVKEYEHILEKVFSDPHLPLELASLKNEVYNYIYVKGALDYIHLKMIIEGIRYLSKAIRISPILSLENTFDLLMQFSNDRWFRPFGRYFRLVY